MNHHGFHGTTTEQFNSAPFVITARKRLHPSGLRYEFGGASDIAQTPEEAQRRADWFRQQGYEEVTINTKCTH